MTRTLKIGRSAKTGEFISVQEARRKPATSVVETIRIKVPKKTK